MLVLACAAAVSACGDGATPATGGSAVGDGDRADATPATAPTTTTTQQSQHSQHGSIGSGVGSTGTDDEGWCATPGPGIALTAEQATVGFSTDQVCPGYVTVDRGTAVTWRNDAGTEHRVVLTSGRAGDGPVVHEVDLASGATFEQTLEPGIYTFTVSAIPAFRGTVEVLDDGAGTDRTD